MIRTCIGCRATDDPRSASLLRFVLVDGRLQRSEVSSGRGVWIHDSPGCVEAALKKRNLERALRKHLPVVEFDGNVVENSAFRAGQSPGS